MTALRQQSGQTNGNRNVVRNPFYQLFQNFFASPLLESSSWTLGQRSFPPLNLWEENDFLYVEAEVPGLKMDQLEIFVKDGELTLHGKRGDAQQREYHRRERGQGAFQRVVKLPFEIDPEKVEATLVDGVLNIKLPKAEAAKPRKIEVKCS